MYIEVLYFAISDCKKFPVTYSIYPNIDSFGSEERLNLREMRQCITALLRHCVPIVGNTSAIREAIENSAGHTANTGFANYGVDRFTALGDQMNLQAANILSVCHSWQLWLNLEEYVFGTPEAALSTGTSSISINSSINDLLLAAQSIYGPDFSFRSGQERIMSAIYLSTTKVFPIQALPGFGKTYLFQVPILAMKKANPLKKFVNFIFVPFISLMANMMTRLSTSGVTCAYFSDISKGSTVAEECDLTADIYI